jgi:Domain of unknown function (DUF4326)
VGGGEGVVTTTTASTRRVKVTGDMFHGKVPAGAKYIGRQMPGLKGSPYANPFSVRKYGRTGALERFRAWVLTQAELIEQARRDLAGCDLACWCGPDAECHGDYWITILDQGAGQ